ncbi:MAG: hypothetical protein KAH38_04960, partial [Candidatus Hydrogenedentes bacterium]|nr:hypothetical protein [Candidatus Hydrogenedentota bacterium]
MKKQAYFTLFIVAVAALCVPYTSNAAILRVDVNGLMTPDGMSWETAYHDIPSALMAAMPADEIWVARGTYVKGAGSRVVEITTNVEIYGGFAATEAAREERDPIVNTTSIDGAFGYPCVSIFSTAVLDGFTFENGYAPAEDGAGVLVSAPGVLIANCIFYNNESMLKGGGLSVDGVDCTIINCSFLNNKAPYGSAISHIHGTKAFGSTSTMINCLFVDNNAFTSGIVFN